MNKPSNPTNKPTKPVTNDKQRGIGVAALLNTSATLGTAVLVGAMSGAKKPIVGGD